MVESSFYNAVCRNATNKKGLVAHIIVDRESLLSIIYVFGC